ncbi:Predicted amidohydrolase [Pseudobutyrivibrio sp. YE44]|uniref:carbon-nitrogen hydrolase family protein n=1 Tax=Pseudobutyrivibrio sp. YE44 TaxID=1520802 RepID=UPI0008813D8D|nr:carbon-nitrogen hydrolase family protein [Pseudobutyrivibrio sp. YE44]SDB49927.1 Predicted amidohydrolase [Pseudobutyrivibrio sp. YE44]
MIYKIAILQRRATNGEIDKNLQLVLDAMSEAADNGADMLLLPECFLTGYDLPMKYDKCVSDDDNRIKRVCYAAKEKHIGVILTSFTKGISAPQNSAFVINKHGEILMKYSKVHTCDFADEKNVEAGTEFKVCDCDGVKLGIMICYDREYPESARILMLKGAEIVLVPNDCGSMAPRINALSTRAYENMIGVAMANPNGANAGCSCAYSPICWDKAGKCIDNNILLVDELSEGLFYADFDMDAIREYRNTEMMGNTFRKVDAYGELLNKEISEPFFRKGQNN